MPTSDTVYSASASSFTEVGEPILSRRRAWVAALVVWAFVACFNRLGEAPVVITNEAREGVYTRAMLASGDFVAPRVANHVENDEVVPDKPPLFHWLAAAATWSRAAFHRRWLSPGLELSQRFDDWALRFPSALAATILVVAVALDGRALVGERAALFGGAALLTSSQFCYQARFGRVDMLLACFASLAAMLGGRSLVEKRPNLLPLAGASAGLAVLAKGPLGLLLPGLACVSFVALQRSWKHADVRALPWRTALVIAALVAIPWYAAAHVATGGATFRSQIYAENVEQFLGPEGRMPELFYIVPWLLDSLPWSVVALASLVAVWRRREAGATFCAVWWLSTLLFFQIAAYKRRAYLLPALPAEALLAGWLLDRWVGSGRAVLDPISRPSPAGLVTAGVAAVLGALAAPPAIRFWVSGPSLAGADLAIAAAGGAAMALALCGFAGAVAERDRARIVVTVWMFLGALYVAILPSALRVTAEPLTARTLVRRIEAALPPGGSVSICGIADDSTLPLLFYARDPQTISVAETGPCVERARPGFYLLSRTEWQRGRRAAENDHWKELFSDEIRGWRRRTPVVFAERLEGD